MERDGSFCLDESPGVSCPITIVHTIHGADHFAGIDAALHSLGADATWIPLELAPQRLGHQTRVVAVDNACSFEALSVLRRARRGGACTVLMMDGITEYRNTFLNPVAGPDFLRPAPVDVIACAGRVDAARLADLGNDAVATGLPRLAAIEPSDLPEQPVIMVATARQPAFGLDERARLVATLRLLRDRLTALGVVPRWRLTGGLDVELGVETDTAPVTASLAGCRGVITTPSTLLIEAMRAGRPTALLYPFDAPCWPRAEWMLDGTVLSDRERLDAAIRSLLEPGPDRYRRQLNVLDEMHRQDRPPAEAVAELLVQLVTQPRFKTRPPATLDPTRLPQRLPARAGRRRVVSLVWCDASPVGGVTTWSQRMGRTFARRDFGYDFRTLLVVTHPNSRPSSQLNHANDDGLTQTCIIDPFADHFRVLATLREAIERLAPDIVLPNNADLCHAAAIQLRRRGVRMVAIAHTDHESVRDLFGCYDRWDGAVGVSDACMAWLEPLAGGRPVQKIVYGVPVAAAPRSVKPDGPLTIAYIGRMIEYQKRISDLLRLIDGLESRSVHYEFHLVGDGPHLDRWRRSLDERRLEYGSVILHGRRTAEWVERFLRSVDASVLVSDYEGTSITMLESMGAGVVPVVTHVSSGVDEWIHDGVNGIVVPIGEPDQMAGRLAELAADRPRINALGHAAWATVTDAVSVETMADRYAELFDGVMASDMDRRRTDQGMRLCERYTWRREWVEQPDEAMRWIERGLGEAGYRNIAIDEPTQGCDAVIVRAGGMEPIEARVSAYRQRGLGVAVWPHLIETTLTDRMHREIQRAVDDGCRRIAIYGIGVHTRRSAGILERGLPIVGFIDDEPPSWRRDFGLPIVAVEDAMQRLSPDAVLLSSDAWEQQMWNRCAPLRAAGVRILTLYGTYDEAARLETGVTA